MKTITLLFIIFISFNVVSAQERYIITSDSVSLYVKVEGNGPACLYIHGGPGSGSYWLEKFFGDFLEQHFTMIYLDQRGVCRSSSPKDHNYSMERMVEDFEEVRETLGIQQWLTMGHSFGGILQMGYFDHYPKSIKGMIMINCTLSMEESFRKSWIPKACEFAGIENTGPFIGDTVPTLKRLMYVFDKLDEKGLRWKMAYASPENEKILEASTNDISNWNYDFGSVSLTIDEYWKDYRVNTSGVNIPVLFFVGKTDWMVGPEHYKGVHFPDMILWTSNVGHMPFLECKTELEGAIQFYNVNYNFDKIAREVN